jgi:hypothetical protein
MAPVDWSSRPFIGRTSGWSRRSSPGAVAIPSRWRIGRPRRSLRRPSRPGLFRAGHCGRLADFDHRGVCVPIISPTRRPARISLTSSGASSSLPTTRWRIPRRGSTHNGMGGSCSNAPLVCRVLSRCERSARPTCCRRALGGTVSPGVACCHMRSVSCESRGSSGLT